MKNILKTLVALLAISIVTYSCDNKNENDPQDPVKDKVENPTNSTNPTDQENENLPITSQNLQGSWILTNWVCSDGSDMSYTLGKKISFFEDGTMYMPTEEWEDLMPIYNQWAYSSVNKKLIFSAEGEESMVYLVKSLTENVLVLEYTAGISHTFTFEKQ